MLQTFVIPHGGACGVAAWTLQALRRDYNVTLLTAHPFDFEGLNRYYGTSLERGDFEILQIHPMIRTILRLDPDPGSIQRSCYLMRRAKKMRAEFDCVLTTDNEADLGAPALQYLHLPYLGHVYPKVLSNLDLPLSAKLSAWCRGEIRPWMALADFSFDRMKRNRTIVNSDWTGRRVRKVYGIDNMTLYPPAPGGFPDVPWEQREDGFVVLGRLNPEKRPDWCLRVLEIVRRSFPYIKVHIIGSTSASVDEKSYYKTLIPLIESNRSWVKLHENISRSDMQQIVTRQRYGMHAMVDEHFGMAVAEMMIAGCLPFVHNSGGPPEIVGENSSLIYDSEEDAAKKIMAILGNPEQQAGLREKLAARKNLFRPEAFVSGIRAEVGRMVSR